MAVFYKILRNLALILFHRLGKKVYGELLLQKGCAFIFFIGENAAYGACLPLAFSRRRWNALACKLAGDGASRFSVHEHGVYPAH